MNEYPLTSSRGLYLLHIHGGTRASAAGEMHEGAIGALLKEPNGTAIPGTELSERLGRGESPTTAEYLNQMNRLWNTGDNLAKLRDEAEEALRNAKDTQVSWVPRNWNKEADALVNKAFGPKTTEITRSQE